MPSTTVLVITMFFTAVSYVSRLFQTWKLLRAITRVISSSSYVTRPQDMNTFKAITLTSIMSQTLLL